jgi:hypothetical protein
MAHMSAVQIGTEDQRLRLVPDDPGRNLENVIAELRSDGLIATRRVYHGYTQGFADLADFFAGFAADWRGWDGARTWESVEGDLRIEAQHKFGHVQLRVTVRAHGSGWGNEGWSATADLTIDPGEQLSQAAAGLADLPRGGV